MHHKAMHLLGNILQDLGKEAEAQKYFVAAEQLVLAAALPAAPPKLHQNTMSTEKSPSTQTMVASDSDGDASRLAGWENLLVATLGLHEQRIIRWNMPQSSESSSDQEYIDIHMRCISTSPRIIVLENFLTPDESRLIRNRSDPILQQSRVMGDSGTSSSSTSSIEDTTASSNQYRISDNAWLAPGVISPLLTHIQSRLAAVTGISVSYIRQMSEHLQVYSFVCWFVG